MLHAEPRPFIPVPAGEPPTLFFPAGVPRGSVPTRTTTISGFVSFFAGSNFWIPPLETDHRFSLMGFLATL